MNNPEWNRSQTDINAEAVRRLGGSKPKRSRYPELDLIASRLADSVCTEINRSVANVESAMPYRFQYVLETLIRKLESRV